MDTKNIKDEQIRKQIITASEVYRDKLAGRVFLYVYGESYFEVVFPTDRFRHLTGVNSLWGDRIFEKCGIRREEEGDGGKTLEIRGKRRLSAWDGGANYQQS